MQERNGLSNSSKCHIKVQTFFYQNQWKSENWTFWPCLQKLAIDRFPGSRKWDLLPYNVTYINIDLQNENRDQLHLHHSNPSEVEGVRIAVSFRNITNKNLGALLMTKCFFEMSYFGCSNTLQSRIRSYRYFFFIFGPMIGRFSVLPCTPRIIEQHFPEWFWKK